MCIDLPDTNDATTGDLAYARKLVTRVQGGEHSAQTPIQQQAFALRGWIDASIREPCSKEEVTLLKESIRLVVVALGCCTHWERATVCATAGALFVTCKRDRVTPTTAWNTEYSAPMHPARARTETRDRQSPGHHQPPTSPGLCLDTPKNR